MQNVGRESSSRWTVREAKKAASLAAEQLPWQETRYQGPGTGKVIKQLEEAEALGGMRNPG